MKFKLRRTPKANAQGAMDLIKEIKMPPLGDSRKVYPVDLTEPEINAIHGAVGYVRENCRVLAELAQVESHPWWAHYGATLEGLSERLGNLDDEDKTIGVPVLHSLPVRCYYDRTGFRTRACIDGVCPCKAGKNFTHCGCGQVIAHQGSCKYIEKEVNDVSTSDGNDDPGQRSDEGVSEPPSS